ncbi:glycoside hydrolase family 3 N-terminal domain-containing protein [Longispora fulva]|uniref:Beta-N-acetylhexosaminidase n=1 Tax=Longispora fulva TaxID=619741 RepID=A0A8J7KJP8_9ACTN|nr:glycoside hydrolase family 3 N-terminal domain-containing protein [Longispora fulva]MBG6137089.1 beta-N-acetylhexosaminidase [Longispora fulva]
MKGAGLTRRGLLAGIGSTAVAAGLGACGAEPAPKPATSGSPGPGTPSASTGTNETALRRKIAGMLVVGFRGDRVGPDDWITRAVRESGVGGVILFDKDQLTGGTRNITSPEQVTALIRALREAAPGRRLIVSVDQEGGQVARLGPANGFPATRSQAQIGALNSPEVTRGWAEDMAATLVRIGVNFTFTPDVDIAVNPTNPAIALLDRSFSANADVVVSCATEAVRAYRKAGVRTSIKHFPGFGSATGNTDFETVDVTDTWTRAELEPFRRMVAAGSVDTVMVTHLLNRQLDPQRPASLSRAVVTDLLRGELGWDGVVVTDDMQAEAISRHYGRDEAVGLALEAGVDQLVFCNQAAYDPAVVEATVGAVVGLVRQGRISEARIDRSVARITALWPPN